jgi:hypothetical protein
MLDVMELICAVVMVLFAKFTLFLLAMLPIIQSNALSLVPSMALALNVKFTRMLSRT